MHLTLIFYFWHLSQQKSTNHQFQRRKLILNCLGVVIKFDRNAQFKVNCMFLWYGYIIILCCILPNLRYSFVRWTYLEDSLQYGHRIPNKDHVIYEGLFSRLLRLNKMEHLGHQSFVILRLLWSMEEQVGPFLLVVSIQYQPNFHFLSLQVYQVRLLLWINLVMWSINDDDTQ